LPVGDYYIKKAGAELYWTNMKAVTNEENPEFKELYGANIDEQLWTITLDGGRYKIVNVHKDEYEGAYYNRFITEKGTFPQSNKIKSGYSQTWNTFDFFYNGTAYAVQRTGNASHEFWRLDASNYVTWSSTTLNVSTDFILEFVSVTEVLSAAITAGQALLDAAVIGTANGEYPQAVCDAFAAALTAASTAVSAGAKAQDLIDFRAAEALFVPNKTLVVAVDGQTQANDYLWGDIIFKSDDTSTGQLTGISSQGLQVKGTVQLKKTFAIKTWYPMGFPFEVASYTGAFDENPELSIWDDTSKDGDFWVKSCDGKEFVYSTTIAGSAGYILQFPTAFTGVEVTFTSVANPVLKNLIESDLSITAGDGYHLVANPSVNNLTLSTPDRYYIYDRNSNTFKLLKEGTATIKPFEAFVVANNIAPAQLKASLNIDDLPTALENIRVNDPVIKTEYFNLQGVKIQQPQSNGFYLQKKTRASLKTEITKIFHHAK
jgi:hypothetical protein